MKVCTRPLFAAALASGLMLGTSAFAQEQMPGMQNNKVPPGHEGQALKDSSLPPGNDVMRGMDADRLINTQLAKYATMADESGDQMFALMAGCGNMTEVELSKAVAAKASDPQVKSLAEMMVKEHSAAQEKLAPIAEKLGVKYPSELPTMKQQELRYLTSLPTEKMEKAYLSIMKSDHLKTVNEYTDHLPMIKDADLKAYATETLAKVRIHTAEVLKTAALKGMPVDLKFDDTSMNHNM